MIYGESLSAFSDNSTANGNETTFTFYDSILNENEIDSSFSCDIVDNYVDKLLCASKVMGNLNPQNNPSSSHRNNFINTYHINGSSNSGCDTTPSNMTNEVEKISRDIELSAKCELFTTFKLNANTKAFFPAQRVQLSDYPIMQANAKIFVPKSTKSQFGHKLYDYFILSANAKTFVPKVGRPILELDGNIGRAVHDPPHSLAEDELSETFLDNESTSPYKTLDNLRVQNMNRIIFAHLNINSIRNKFDMLSDLIKGKVDILLISETKLDESFPSSQFSIPGFSTPYRLDRTGRGGGIMLYVREDVPSKRIHSDLSANLECFFVEFNLYKKKWLICSTYNPCESMISNHLDILRKCFDKFLTKYENFIIMGDFNSEPKNDALKEFFNLFDFKNLVKEPTCYKNPENHRLIDLIITNRSKMFQNTINVETGLSDFHLMTITVLKSYFKKCKPKIIAYRDYKYFSNSKFRTELMQLLFNQHRIYEMSNDEFSDIATNIFERHVPLKYKYIRANEGPFMNKELRKAVMLRSKFRNIFNRSKSESDKIAYKTQRNLCTNLFRKAKLYYYSNLNPSSITDNKKFWKTVKPLFSEKVASTASITIVENGTICSDDSNVAQIFNDFFSNVVKNLNIITNSDVVTDNLKGLDPVHRAILKYEHHPSVLKIKEAFGNSEKFSLEHCMYENVCEEIKSLNISKACPKSTLPSKIIKDNYDFFALKLHNDLNRSIDDGEFPNNLKLADITPVHKKDDRTDKTNYRPVSILPAISKIYERIIFYQIDKFMDNKISKHQCGFRKGYSAQHCLIVMLEKWRASLDKRGFAGVLLTDLSKAFDCLDHDLLVAKIEAYGFDFNSTKLLHSYLTNRYQRARINSNYSRVCSLYVSAYFISSGM